MKKVIIAIAAYFSYLGYQFVVSASTTLVERTTEIDAILNAIQ